MRYFALALCLAPLACPALAATTITSASVDSTTVSDQQTDGSPSSSSVGGNGSASATAALDEVRVIFSDTIHFSDGAPGGSARSTFGFSVLGASGPVQLAFNFLPIGQFNLGSASTIRGGFEAYLVSTSGVSPALTGSLTLAQFGPSRAGDGRITAFADRSNPLAPTSIRPWLGEPIQSFTLSSSFMGNTPNAGALTLSAIGGGGNSNADFLLRLASITSPDGLQGLTVVADNGRIFQVGSGVMGAVPEPATWAMMLFGFGIVGMTMRRRRRTLMPCGSA